jgi:hypothetical protein
MRPVMSAMQYLAKVAVSRPDGTRQWQRSPPVLWRMAGTSLRNLSVDDLERTPKYVNQSISGTELRCKCCSRHVACLIRARYPEVILESLARPDLSFTTVYYDTHLVLTDLYRLLSTVWPPHTVVPLQVASIDQSKMHRYTAFRFNLDAYTPAYIYPQFEYRCIECRQHVGPAGTDDEMIADTDLRPEPIGITEHGTIFTRDRAVAEIWKMPEWKLDIKKWRPVVRRVHPDGN